MEYHIDNNNLDVVSISEASFNWSLLPYNTFQGINDENYQLSLSFKVNDTFFDDIKKQIIIEQSYDSAAIPWVELFLQVALIMLLVSLSTLVFLIKYYKKKYLTKQCS